MDFVDSFALLFAAVAAGLTVAVAASKANRSLWSEVRVRDRVIYVLLATATVAVSLFHFDSVNNHAWRPHEESLWFAMRANIPQEGWHPLEVQVLVRQIYRGVGLVLGAHPEASWDELKYAFVATAFALGGWGAVLTGLAGQFLTRRAWIGYGAAALLVLYPTLAYWRVNAFHVAPSHTVFCLTLLAAVVVARRPSRLNLTAWFVLGALCLFFRSEQAGSVAATAAIPLFCSEGRAWALLKRWKDWVPGLLVGAVLLTPPTITNMRAAVERQDYRTGWRFLKIHLSVGEIWEPLIWPGLLVLVAFGMVCAFAPRGRLPADLSRAARALVLIAVLGVLPTIFFTSFGARHLLNSGTAGILLAMVGLAAFESSSFFEGRRGTARLLTAVVAVSCLGPIALQCWTKMDDWGARYYIRESKVPPLPDTPTPTGKPEFNVVDCGTYASAWQLCDGRIWPQCHPPKDLRDPMLVRARWDKFDGCLVWGVDETDNEVAGTRHEWWMVTRNLYRWRPLGIIEFEEDGKMKQVDVYRMTERP